MAIYLIILGIMVAIMLACFLFGRFANHPIFVLSGFVLLMLTGIILYTSGGVIIGSQITPTTEAWEYTNVVVSTSEPTLNIFAMLSLLLGAVLTIAGSLFLVLDSRSTKTSSPFNW